jgi:arginyl-tRNA synthetase
MYHGEIEQSIGTLLEKSLHRVFKDLGVHAGQFKETKAEIEIPKEKAHGDLSSNIAMRACKGARKSPQDLAALIKARFEASLGAAGLDGAIERVEVKSPGFINFFLSRNYLSRTLLEIKRMKNNYGRSSVGRGVRLQVEFVSANPTGPLTIAHGRQAAIGDSLSNILDFLGYKVTREYYLNDEGNQMKILGNSIRIRYLEACGAAEEFPQDGYKGSYIYDIARAFRKRHGRRFAGTARAPAGKDPGPFTEFGMRWILDDIRKDLRAFGVRFDVWYSQKALARSGKVERAVAFLKEKGYIYENEGAVWFKSTAFGDDKDRVIYKSDGSATYLTPDIAYHLEKYRRGFRKIVDIWGPDHHGYIPRMKAAIRALGFRDDSLSVLIVQLATLYRGGQAVSMSTRAGEFVTLREVMDEVGKDVARFCFIMRRISSHLDFDLDAVKKESMENPVYYIQYAHARIWSILDRGRGTRLGAKFDSALLDEPEELGLMRMLRQFPLVVSSSGSALEPYTVLQYLQDLAAVFHSFYTKHKVLCDEPDLARSRLVLVDCVRIVLANGLRLLGVSLPRKM